MPHVSKQSNNGVDSATLLFALARLFAAGGVSEDSSVRYRFKVLTVADWPYGRRSGCALATALQAGSLIFVTHLFPMAHTRAPGGPFG